MKIFVFVTKYRALSTMVLQFLTVAFPHVDMEVAYSMGEIKTKNPHAIIAVREDEPCDQMLSVLPGAVYFIAKGHEIEGLAKILKSETQ